MALLGTARRRSLLSRILLTTPPPQRPLSASSAAAFSGGRARHAPAADADEQPSSSSSPLARELRGWLRFISPFSRYSATFYRTDAAIADRAVALVLEEHARQLQRRRRRAAAASAGGAVVVDLGCGDGAIMLAALRAPTKRVVGYELCAQLAAEARRRCAAEVAGGARLPETTPPPPPPPPRPEFEVVEGDASDADLSDADAVFLYMSASANARLLGPGPAGAAAEGAAAGKKTAAAACRSASTLRPGAVVASLGFPVEGWDAWMVEEGGQRALSGRGGAGTVPFYMYVYRPDVPVRGGEEGMRAGGGG